MQSELRTPAGHASLGAVQSPNACRPDSRMPRRQWSVPAGRTPARLLHQWMPPAPVAGVRVYRASGETTFGALSPCQLTPG
eukprot:410700-Alexandrium_andersonii.AAC.1